MRIHALASSPPVDWTASLQPHWFSPSSVGPSRLRVSPLAFTICWWFLFVMHLFNGLFASVFFGIYAFFGMASVYPTIVVLKIPLNLVRISTWSYAVLAGFHWLSLTRMIWRSLRKKQLSFPKPATPTSPSKPGATISTRLTSCQRRFWAPWNRIFGVDGLFGVNGAYFYALFVFREALEIGLQTYQANQLSRTVRRSWITHLAVVTIVLNSISAPLVHLVFCKKPDSVRRFANLLVDMALDFCCATVIPICVIYPYVAQYDASIGSFPIALVNDDTWFITSLAEIRLFLVTSEVDLAATVMPHVTVYTCLNIIKKLIERESSGSGSSTHSSSSGPQLTPTTTNLISPAPLFPPSLVQTTSASPPKYQSLRRMSSATAQRLSSSSATIQRVSSATIQRMSSTRSQRFFHTFCRIALVAWTVSVLIIHMYAHRHAAVSALPGCRLTLNAWFARQTPCAVMQVNCYHEQIDGLSSELAQAIMPLDRGILKKLIITHCPRLEIPALLLEFNEMTDLDLYNSTLISWPMEAAATPTGLQSLSTLSWLASPYIRFPASLLHTNLPTSFSRVFIAKSNLTELPDELGTIWATQAFDIISVQFTKLQRLPPSFGQFRTRKLRLISNQVATLSDDALTNKRLEVLDLSGNPLTALPASMGDTSRLSQLLIEHTEITTLHLSVSQWWGARPQPGRRRLSLFGSPFCEPASSVDTTPEICETDYGSANGTHPWAAIESQRSLEM